jgi:hypothetical protein
VANTLLTPTTIARRGLAILRNNLGMASRVYREYVNEFQKIGGTVTIRKPNRFTVSSGPALSVQNVVEPSTTLTVDQQKHVDFSFTSVELTLTIDEFARRYLEPAMATLANYVDYTLLGLYNTVGNSVGTPGTTPATYAVLGSAMQKLDENSARMDQRTTVLNPAAHWAMADALKGLFNPNAQIGRIVQRGELGEIASGMIFSDQNVNRHTTGTRGGTPLVNGASQSGSTLITDGWTAAAANRVKKGDVFTIAGVNAVNPQNRVSTGSLQQFVVTADTSSDGSGNATIPIFPAITASGAYQTVDAAPADNAAMTFMGTASTSYAQNLVFTPDAFALATVPLELPRGVDFAAREEDGGISMRIVRQYDINNDVIPCRIDILYGMGTLYGEQAARIWGE